VIFVPFYCDFRLALIMTITVPVRQRGSCDQVKFALSASIGLGRHCLCYFSRYQWLEGVNMYWIRSGLSHCSNYYILPV